MGYEEKMMKIPKKFGELAEDFKKHLISSGLAKSTVKKHTDNMNRFLNEFLLKENVTDIEDGIELLDSYFFGFIGGMFLAAPLTVINGNITSLKKLYRFLEDGKYVSPGTYIKLNEDIKAHKDDWLMLAQGFDTPDEEPCATAELFQLVKEYTGLAPWNWLDDLDIIAVEFSDEKDIFFCNVFKKEGEFYGFAVYRGSGGLSFFLKILEGEEEFFEDAFMYANHMALHLVDREEIDSTDYELIEKSGVTFSGRKSWPTFSIYNPGYLPVLPDNDGLRLMERILSVINPFLASIKSNPEKIRLLYEEKILCRRYGINNEFILEHELSIDRYLEENPQIVEVPVVYDDLMIKRIKKDLKKTKALWEVDISFTSDILAFNWEKVYPAMLVVADKGSGEIIKVDMVSPDNLEDLQLSFLEAIKAYKSIPKKVEILYKRNNIVLFDLLEKLSINVEIVDKLEVIPLKKREVSKLSEHLEFFKKE